jgi:hypothetical protein
MRRKFRVPVSLDDTQRRVALGRLYGAESSSPRSLVREIRCTAEPVTFERSQVQLLESGALRKSVLFRGQRFRVDLQKEYGQEGLPWRGGLLFVEDDPARHPLLARGFGTDLGKGKDLLNTPEIESNFEGLLGAMVNAPWQIRKPVLPSYLEGQGDKQKLLDLQWSLQQRIWALWRRRGTKEHFKKSFLRPVLYHTFLNGLYTGEMTARPWFGHLPGDDRKREWRLALPPGLRGPHTILEWITQKDKIVGVVFSYGHTSDSFYTVGEYQVIIPYDKLIHIVARQVGLSDAEGRRHVRCLETPAAMLRNALEKQALATATVALGTVVVTLGDDVTDDDADELEAEFANMDAGHLPYIFVTEGTEVKWISPMSTMPVMDGQITAHLNSIAMGMGKEGRQIGIVQHGSNAARVTGSKEGQRVENHIAVEYGAYGVEQAFRWILSANFPQQALDDELFVAQVVPGKVDRLGNSELLKDVLEALREGVLDLEEAKKLVREIFGT